MKEVIILAGGKGTRLQHLLPGIPKCMASIQGKPFISYILNYLIKQEVDHFIFSLGFLSSQIESFLNTNYPKLNKTFVIEEKALGTGGAIIKSLEFAKQNKVFVINGDTYFPVSLESMLTINENTSADLIIASTLKDSPRRFGTISFQEDKRIISFHEKKDIASGYINGGSYLVTKSLLLGLNMEESFSFEKEILEKKLSQWKMYADVQDSYFIDIGIPEDYQKAQIVLPTYEVQP